MIISKYIILVCIKPGDCDFITTWAIDGCRTTTSSLSIWFIFVYCIFHIICGCYDYNYIFMG